MTWTHFYDMHSGGRCKIKENGQDIEHIYIEADHKTAEQYFEQLFGRDPNHTTCKCCGEDYAVSEHQSLQKASGYERNCRTIKPIKADGYEDPAYKTAEYKEHYYLEEGETPPEGYTVDDRSYSSRPGITIEEYSTNPRVKALTKKQICKLLNKVQS